MSKIVRNVGIKVLDGTESWSLNSNRFRVSNLVPVSESNVMMCSHFAFTGNLTTDNTIYRAIDSAYLQVRYDTANNDVTVFKAYLAEQYAAGTPVIILYPLETPTTETVTAQPITQAVGTNIATISEGSITSLVGEVSGINQTQTTPTPESPLDIVSNNGAIKCGQYGKNLFDSDIFLGVTDWQKNGDEYFGDMGKLFNKYFTSGMVSFNGKPNTQYTFSYNIKMDGTIYGGRARIIYSDNSYTDLTAYLSTDKPNYKKITGTSENGKTIVGIKFPYTAGEGNAYFKEFMIEEGTTITPYEPYHFGLYTEGTQEKITVSDGTNVLDKYGIVQPNVMYEVNFIGQNFVASCANTGTVRFRWYDENKTQINYYTLNDVDTTLNRKYKYASFTETKYTKYVMFETTDSSDFKLELDVSTPTKYVAPQTVVAGMLNKIGTYQDIQNIVNGSVSKNVGIKVLDGTESWARDNTDIYMNKSTLFGYDIPRNTLFYMTHFKNTYDINGFSIGTVTFYMKNTGWDTVQVFKDFLASEYAKGTPVIILYPLATPTTESVAAQDIDINKGTYTAEVTEASLADLDISVKYLGNE